jgi:hypothetical protein
MKYGETEEGDKIVGEIANPRGITKEVALDLLSDMKAKMGDEKYAKLEGYIKQFREVRNEKIISVLKDADMYGKELMEKIEDNENYATFDVLAALEKRFGRGVTGHIYKQLGTLADIDNPFVATVMKDASLIRAVNVKKAKESMVKVMKESFPDEIMEAKKKWNGKYNEPIDPKDPDYKMLTYLHQGKVKAYYVPKGIAETFNREPYEAIGLLKLWQAVNVPLRNVLVTRNPMWMMFNTVRDFIGSVKHIPKLSGPKLAKYYVKSFKDAWKDAIGGKRVEVVSEMLQKRMLVMDRQYSSYDISDEKEAERQLNSFGKTPVRYRNRVIRPFTTLWDYLGRAGKFTERWAKISGYEYLKAESGKSDKEIAHLVRSRVGTPDIYRRGRWNPLTNNLFLFSNVAKEGWRASWEAYRESKAEYAWKTFKYNFVPKIMLAACLAGHFGDKLQGVAQTVSDYDKENYTIVPLGFTKLNKGVYLRIPQDYTGQVVSGLAWNIINGELFGNKSVLDYGATQSPYSINPYLEVAGDLITYYGRGLNPYDDYHGKNVLNERVYTAGGTRANTDMMKHTWNSLGGSVLYKFKGSDIDKIQSELEDFLGHPPGTWINRFLKVSTYGVKEDLREITKDVAKGEARRQLEVRDRIIKAINNADGKPTTGDAGKVYRELKKEGLIGNRSVAQFRHQFMRFASRTPEDPEIDAVVSARSGKEKAALLKHYRKTISKGKYHKIRRQLMKEGHITTEIIILSRRNR